MIDYLIRGGPVMIPLLLSSVLALGVILERFWALRTPRVLPPAVTEALLRMEGSERVDTLLRTCQQYASPLSRMLAQGVMNRKRPREDCVQILYNVGRRETHDLERGLLMLELVAGIAPLLGLLGTVLGMVNIFDVITQMGMGQAQVLSKGISQALITTIAGLFIGIPALAAYNFFAKRVDDLVIELERQITVMLHKIYGSAAPDSLPQVTS
ncbi:MAG: MotA/TolQ/ExbB proton channel family protein [Candidatus Omnitrophica bacterium]|nr:MotA/TolQ/ExbB proton channel family protein [Candidatus Omnitrophota bacterium]